MSDIDVPHSARPLPQPDRDSAPYWAALREGRLELQRCRGCQAWRWPARAICNRCHGFDAEWTPTSGRGRIVSWVVTHQAFAPGFADALPYATVAVALDEQEDCVLLGGLVSGAPSQGLLVRAVFQRVSTELALLQWEPVID